MSTRTSGSSICFGKCLQNQESLRVEFLFVPSCLCFAHVSFGRDKAESALADLPQLVMDEISFRARPALLLMKSFMIQGLPISGPPIMFEFQGRCPACSLLHFFHMGFLTSRPPRRHETFHYSGPPDRPAVTICSGRALPFFVFFFQKNTPF